jgi:diadenosine tetraphosphatase ApaH/serine/threonine PP2A family protein phosphatase
MRLAVLSDIHANLTALDAALADLATQPAVDQVWACGDIVGYGPQPNEVIDRLRQIDARAVMGNHDGAAVGLVDVAWFNDAAAAAIQWTAGVLTADSRAFLAALPKRRVEGELTAVHGSPRDPIWEYIVSPDVAAANLDRFDTRTCLFGHTHYPVLYAAADGTVRRIEAPSGTVVALPDARLMLNPGSVGQPRDGNPDSSYLIVDLTAATAEFRRVPYDIGRTQDLMRAEGLPTWLAERLSHGR